MRKEFSANGLLICVAAILASFTLTHPFAREIWLADTGPSWWGLDISWEVTLNYAAENKWVWGKDIVYTYGPLGFLATRIGLGIWRWTFLAFDIFLVFNFAVAFFEFLRSTKDRWLAFFIILLILLVINTTHGGNLSWVLLFFAFVWMYKTFHSPRLFYFILLGLNILVCFYMKLNTGLICVLLFAGHLGNMIIFKRIKWLYAALVFTSLIAGIVIASFMLHVSLPGYLKSASEIIKGYNDIMHLDMDYYAYLEVKVRWLYYSFLVFIGIYIIALIRTKRYSELFFAGLALAYVFLLRKQCSLRNDEGHYIDFFAYGPLLLLCAWFFNPFEKMQRPLAVCVLLLSTISLLYKYEARKMPVDDALAERFARRDEYITAFENYGKVPFLNNRHKRYIPDRVLSQIQNKTVDIFPWDSEYIIENGLNYKPRPMFQSFSSYTSYLHELNYKFYEKNAPEYIIYDFETIDGRYPFNDDLLANFFISRNYTFADSFTSNERWRVLYKKNETIVPVIQEKTNSAVYKLNQEIPVNGAILKASINFTPLGKFESVYYATPRVAIKMLQESGVWVEYKVSKQVLEAGIFIDKALNDNGDFLHYVTDRQSMGKILKVKIVADEDYYKEDVKIEFYNVK